MFKISRILTASIIQISLACLLVAGAKASMSDSPRNSIETAPSRHATLDGARVHYKSFGKGATAVVFVHGWTCNMNFWRGQAAAFESATRVVVIDLPGHGASDKPQVDYSMDYFARAVDAVMRDAKIEKAVLVGHSMGTPVIRQFYRKYPEKTLALVIVDGGLRPFISKEQMRTFTAPLRGPNYKEAAAQLFEGMLMPVKSAELRQEIKSSMLSTPQHVTVSAMDGMTDDAIFAQDKINVPVLAILAKSPFWPSDNEQFYRSLAPNIDYQMWDGVSHFLMMEEPARFNEAVFAFMMKNKLIKKK